MSELATLYNGLLKSSNFTLEALEYQYSDFCNWQRSDAAASIISDQLLFWEEFLANTAPFEI